MTTNSPDVDEYYASLIRVNETLQARIAALGQAPVFSDLRRASRNLMHALLRMHSRDASIVHALLRGQAVVDQVITAANDGNDRLRAEAEADLRRFTFHGVNGYGYLAYNALFRPNPHGDDHAVIEMLAGYWSLAKQFGPRVLKDLAANMELAGTDAFQDLTIEPVD